MKGGEIFSYEGDFAAVPVDWLTGEVRRKMEAAPVSPRARARLFASFVEMTQNILHYAEPDAGGGRRSGAIAFGHAEDGYWISCRNPVRIAHAERLRERLGRLQAMPPDQIRAEYVQRLSKGPTAKPDPLSRGAGLGLLAIARSSGEPLAFRLEPSSEGMGDRYTFFLRASIRATPGRPS